MTYAESKKILDGIRNGNEIMFRMAISHLIDVGIRHLNEENISRTCEEIQREDDSKLGMTNNFKCDLVRIAGELAKIDHIHLLVYIQREVFYDVSDNGISYGRAIQIIQKCIDWITCDVEFADAIADLNAIGFDEEEIKEFGFNYLFDAEEETKMTLYEYLEQTTDWELTVWDKDYDIETYFYKTDGKDKWDKAMNDLARLLTISRFSEDGLVVNLAEVIERKIPQLKEADLFIECNIVAIMDCIDSILAGNVSEEWLERFVEVLNKED